jgi:hypothetical protein
MASGRDCESLKFVVLYLSLSRWTGRRFLFARLPQAKRYATCRGTERATRIGTFACRTFQRDPKASKRANLPIRDNELKR